MSNNSIKDQVEKAYILVEDKFMLELSEANTQEEVHDMLYAELNNVIQQYDLDFITADKVLPEFWKVWGLRS